MGGLRAVPLALATRKVVGLDANFRVSPFFVRLHCPPNSASHFRLLPLSTQLNHPAFHETTIPAVASPTPTTTRPAAIMSSPSKRSTRSSATPRRATRGSQQPSSPAAGPSDAAERTPRQARPSQLASSPLFYQSSSPAPGANRASSPLRHMSNSQSTANNAPSSPLRQQTETQSAGDRTPRASGALIGGEP
jgi:hypothetical protein